MEEIQDKNVGNSEMFPESGEVMGQVHHKESTLTGIRKVLLKEL